MPLCATEDGNQHIAAELGLVPHEAVHDASLSLARGLFVVGKDKTLRLSHFVPVPRQGDPEACTIPSPLASTSQRYSAQG